MNMGCDNPDGLQEEGLTEEDAWRPETVAETENRVGRNLSAGELEYKAVLDTLCACGHYGHIHSAPVIGGPEGYPCWAMDCPCYSFPEGLTLDEKQAERA
jgi:hypothetical protein